MAGYDVLVVGSGLFGSVVAHEAVKHRLRTLVIERRTVPGGNIVCESRDGIKIHRYGAHIFHTSNETVWNYVTQFSKFNSFVNMPVANYKGQIYNLPFNMNTFSRMWGISTPAEAQEIIERQRAQMKGREPANLEEQAIGLVGWDIYEKLIKGYTEKQWGRPCTELPAFIIRRLPVRFVYDNNYFNDVHQGIPIEGYNAVIDHLLQGSEVRCGVDFHTNRSHWRSLADVVVYTGPLDALYDFSLGELEYRSVSFKDERIEVENKQGVAVMNYTEAEVPWTRIIEHKHFEFGNQAVTWISKEYPADYHETGEPYYPVNNQDNQQLYAKYESKARSERGLVFGGRLAGYQYHDMDKTIASALSLSKELFQQ